MAEAWTSDQNMAFQCVRMGLFEFFPREKVTEVKDDPGTFEIEGFGSVWLNPAPDAAKAPSQIGASSSQLAGTPSIPSPAVGYTASGGWPTWTFTIEDRWTAIRAVEYAAAFLRRAAGESV